MSGIGAGSEVVVSSSSSSSPSSPVAFLPDAAGFSFDPDVGSGTTVVTATGVGAWFWLSSRRLLWMLPTLGPGFNTVGG